MIAYFIEIIYSRTEFIYRLCFYTLIVVGQSFSFKKKDILILYSVSQMG